MNENIKMNCDVCGKENLHSYTKCEKHEFTLCDKCSISMGNRILCPDEAREIIPISRNQFKILMAVSNNIVDTKDISKVTDIPIQKTIELVKILSDFEFLIKNQGSITISPSGKLAFSVYSQFFGAEQEMEKLDEEVIKFVKSL